MKKGLLRDPKTNANFKVTRWKCRPYDPISTCILCNNELTNRWLPRGRRRRLNTRSSLCSCVTGYGIISRVVLKEAMTLEELFWSRLRSKASNGTFCSEHLLNLTLNPQTPSKYTNRSFPETAFCSIECYSRHISYLSDKKDAKLRKQWPKPSNAR